MHEVHSQKAARVIDDDGVHPIPGQSHGSGSRTRLLMQSDMGDRMLLSDGREKTDVLATVSDMKVKEQPFTKRNASAMMEAGCLVTHACYPVCS